VAVAADIFYSDGTFDLDLYPDEARERVGADPPVPDMDPDSPVWFYWDGEKLEHREYELLGVTVLDLDLLTEEAITEAERVPSPRIDCPAAGLFNVHLGDVLRWAKRRFPGRRVGLATEPAVTTPIP
jgi:hypothetical protein